MVDLKQQLEKELAKLEKRIAQTAQERDESATPMESASDQTRQVANQLYNSLLEERQKLIDLKSKIKPEQKIYTLVVAGKQKRFLIVPDGMGGVSIGDLTLLSEKAPLAIKILSEKKD